MYNCLIIGCGNKGATSDAPGTPNGHKYLSFAHAIKDHPAFAISEMDDTDPKAIERAYRTWGDGNHKLLDVAIVTTPDNTHYKVLMDLLRYNLKLVIAEKPLCETVEQARKIVNMYRDAGIPLMVDYTRRYIPKFREAYDKIDQGIFGKFLKGYCYFNRGFLHTFSHFADLALWYNGSLKNIEVREIEPCYQWAFQWGLFYENDFISEHAVNLKTEKVSTIYDNHLKYVMENAYNFLERNEPLFCTGGDALKALEETIRIKGENQ